MNARLIIDDAASGAWNMAVDQALLESAEQQNQITLRMYQWSEPTLSLGYFQKLEDRKLHASSLDCSVVRRKTGGGAILHHHELTYSLTVPHQNRWSSKNSDLYELVHRCVIDELAEAGMEARLYSEAEHAPIEVEGELPVVDGKAFLCFQRRSAGDIVFDGWKITGSAQRRLKRSLLQHGSILLHRSEFAPELPGLSQWGQTLDQGRFGANLANRVASLLHLELSSGSLTQAEKELANTHRAVFEDACWLLSR
ncbi:MAG: lipoate--protein ligase family protein [Planctomycetota bacterium]